MARCKWCKRRGLFLRVDANGLCRNCEHLALEIHTRARVLGESIRLAKEGKSFSTRLSRCELAIEHAEYMVQFDVKGVPTVSPSPSHLLDEFRAHRTALIVDEAKSITDNAFEKSSRASTGKAKERVLSSSILKVRNLAQLLEGDNSINTMEKKLRQEIQSLRSKAERISSESKFSGKNSIEQAGRASRAGSALQSSPPPELANKVDGVIQLFIETPVMDQKRRKRLADRFIRTAVTKMVDEGKTYGQASGAPDFFNQDEKSFRAFIKQTDQDLDWQCDTVAAAFERFQETGEVPAPHYPMRIAVLLRKAKDLNRERQFLSAWCNHFPSGNGATYGKLLARAKKVGAI